MSGFMKYIIQNIVYSYYFVYLQTKYDDYDKSNTCAFDTRSEGLLFRLNTGDIRRSDGRGDRD